MANFDKDDEDQAQGGFAYRSPMQPYAYGPEPLPGITSGPAPRPWGTIDRDRGTPLDQMPEGGNRNSGFTGTLERIRPLDPSADSSMAEFDDVAGRPDTRMPNPALRAVRRPGPWRDI